MAHTKSASLNVQCMLYLKIGRIWRYENHIPCIFEYKIPRFRRHTRLKPRLCAAFFITGRGESEYVKTSNAKFEQLRGYTQGASRPSERFEPRQTTVCRLNPHVPNRKLKPPQMRRVEFSGRSVNTC